MVLYILVNKHSLPLPLVAGMQISELYDTAPVNLNIVYWMNVWIRLKNCDSLSHSLNLRNLMSKEKIAEYIDRAS